MAWNSRRRPKSDRKGKNVSLRRKPSSSNKKTSSSEVATKRKIPEFPYRRKFTTDAAILRMMENLRGVSPLDRLYEANYNIHNLPNVEHLFLGRSLIVVHNMSDWEDHDLLASLWTEPEQIKSRFSHKMTPMEYWRKNHYRLIGKQKRTGHELREQIYKQSRVDGTCKEVTSFRPVNFMFLVEFLEVNSVLDMCAGWGDRLVAAIASDLEHYVGVDCNPGLKPLYEEIIEFFKPEGHFEVHTGQAESIDLGSLLVDAMITSPPYFDLEQYPEPNQSSTNYPKEYMWTKEFLFAMMENSLRYIRDGGYLVMIINQRPKQKYISKMLEWGHNRAGLWYLGCIAYSSHNPQPMWIWKKSVTCPAEVYNPHPILEDFKILHPNGSTRMILPTIRDDKLPGGLMQRALLQMPSLDTVHVRGDTPDVISIALVADRVITHGDTRFTKAASQFAELYYAKEPIEELPQKIYNQTLEDALVNAISNCLTPTPERLWIMADSPQVVQAMLRVYTRAQLLVLSRIPLDIRHPRVSYYRRPVNMTAAWGIIISNCRPGDMFWRSIEPKGAVCHDDDCEFIDCPHDHPQLPPCPDQPCLKKYCQYGHSHSES